MNRAVRIVAGVMGIVFAISGMTHGFFETLQGNTPTPGLFIEAIGESRQAWASGAEPAFTLIPNFLITGLAAIGVSLILIVWCAAFLHMQRGATVFLLLFILLFLVGGGIAQIVFFIPAWAFATRINQPLTWWRRALPAGARPALARLWPWTLGAASLLLALALEIAAFGYFPGVSEHDALVSIMMAAVGVGLGLYVLSFVSALAADIERQAGSRRAPRTQARAV